MATATAQRERVEAPQQQPAQQAQSRGEVVSITNTRLPYDARFEERFGIDKTQWRVLTEATFPAAKTVEAVLMALSYCAARKLDVFKKPVHIVPMWSSQKNAMVETVWPGIAELRTTAFRTNSYAGCDAAEFGPTKKQTFKGKVKVKGDWKDVEATVEFPEWCRITVHRELHGRVCKFVGPKVKWLESYATQGNSDVPNEMWQSRPEGQLEKCAEAAALRKAFPEELGNDLTAEEMEGRLHDAGAAAKDVTPREEPPAPPPPPGAPAAAAEAPAAPAPAVETPAVEPEIIPPSQQTAAPAADDDGPPDFAPRDDVAVDDDIPSRLDRRKQAAAAKPAEKPVSDTPPDWSKSLQAFLEWADAVLTKVVDPDFLERTFNEKINPHTKGMFPPDEDELLGIYTKHERRLGIG